MSAPIGSTIGSILADLRDEGTTLFRQEIALARAELSQKATEIGKNTLEIVTGGAVAFAGGIILLVGLALLASHGLVAAGVDETMAQWIGFIGVGLIVAVIGWSLLAKAKRHLADTNLVPEKTLSSLREDKRWAAQKIPTVQ